MKPIRFGTSGWRAIIAEAFTFDNVKIATQAIAHHLKEKKTAPRGIVIGYDPRFLSPEFARTVSQVLAGNGIRSWLSTTFMPTPVVAFEILKKGAAGGINITASHNPAEYSGLKFNSEWGGPALPEETRRIEKHCDRLQKGQGVKILSYDEAKKKGLIMPLDAKESYFKRLKELVDFSALRKAKLKVVADPLYGAGAGYLEDILSRAGCVVRALHTKRDVLFGGHHPEPAPLQLTEMVGEMRKMKAVLGLATDGDADRFGIVDSDGSYFSPNQVIALLLSHLVKTRDWKGPAVRSIASSHWIDEVAKKRGVSVIETQVGFKFVGEAMLKEKGTIGGEESGGLTILGHVPEKDGILACLLIAEMVAVNRKSLRQILKELQQETGIIYSDRVNFRLSEEKNAKLKNLLKAKPPREFAGIAVASLKTQDGYKFLLQDESWIMIRFSGTEPLVRMYWESKERKKFQALAAAGKKLILSM